MTADQQRTILFILGIAAFGYMLVWFPIDRDPWPFVVLIAGMLGLPAFIRADRKMNGSASPDGDTTDDPQA